MKDHLPENLLKAIEERRLAPIPRWRFLLYSTTLWLWALLSIVVGGIAFSVADYVFFDNDGIQQSSVADIAQSIPYIWLLMLCIFTALAYLGFRKTKKGYKYATAGVVVVAILASAALGLILNALDFGQVVHKYLLAHTDFYDSLIHSSEDNAD